MEWERRKRATEGEEGECGTEDVKGWRRRQHRLRQAPVRCIASTTTCFQQRLGHPPTSQRSTRQLSQSCRERNQQRETILSTTNQASSTHFAMGSCARRDDESQQQSLRTSTEFLLASIAKDNRHLIPVSQHQRPQWKRLQGLLSGRSRSARPVQRRGIDRLSSVWR